MWRDLWFSTHAERHGGVAYHVVVRPACGSAFDHNRVKELQADHIWPYSWFGETSSKNLQYLCGDCKRASDLVESDRRTALGQGAFRELLVSFLRAHRDFESRARAAVFTGILDHLRR